MDAWEYRIEPAPLKGKGAKGIRGRDAKYANALSLVMNELGAQGWEYLRADTLPCEERAGLTSKTIHYVNMLVFRRKIATEAEMPAEQPGIGAISLNRPPVALPAGTPEWKGFVEDAEFETEDAEVISVVDLLAARRERDEVKPQDAEADVDPAQSDADVDPAPSVAAQSAANEVEDTAELAPKPAESPLPMSEVAQSDPKDDTPLDAFGFEDIALAESILGGLELDDLEADIAPTPEQEALSEAVRRAVADAEDDSDITSIDTALVAAVEPKVAAVIEAAPQTLDRPIPPKVAQPEARMPAPLPQAPAPQAPIQTAAEIPAPVVPDAPPPAPEVESTPMPAPKAATPAPETPPKPQQAPLAQRPVDAQPTTPAKAPMAPLAVAPQTRPAPPARPSPLAEALVRKPLVSTEETAAADTPTKRSEETPQVAPQAPDRPHDKIRERARDRLRDGTPQPGGPNVTPQEARDAPAPRAKPVAKPEAATATETETEAEQPDVRLQRLRAGG